MEGKIEYKHMSRVSSFLPFFLFFFPQRAKLPPSEYVPSVLMGRRYTGAEALDAKIIQAVIPGPELLQFAIKKGAEVAKENFDRQTLEELKNALYFSTVKALCEPNSYHAKL